MATRQNVTIIASFESEDWNISSIVAVDQILISIRRSIVHFGNGLLNYSDLRQQHPCGINFV